MALGTMLALRRSGLLRGMPWARPPHAVLGRRGNHSSIGAPGPLQPATAALARRVQLFEAEKARQAAVAPPPPAGEVVAVSPDLPAPLVRAPAWAPIEALKHIAKGDDDRPVVAVRVNGELRGLHDRIAGPGRVELEFVRFGDSGDGTRTFWHSAAHVVGASLEAFFGNRVQLCDGPPLLDAEGGFFYEMHLVDDAGVAAGALLSDAAGDARIPGLLQATAAAAAGGGKGKGASAADAPPPLVDPGRLRMSDALFAPLEAVAKKLIAARLPFERLEVTRDFAAGLFATNPFKLDMLGRIPAGEAVSLYRCGPFVDLCRGPHVPHTGLFRGLRLFKSSGSHWQPASTALGGGAPAAPAAPPAAAPRPQGGELLQRVYGVAFPTPAQLAAWQGALDEARRRDHRVIGRAQGLFFFHDLSPGSAFMLPHGTRIYNTLVALLRREYRRRGYEEVMSPLMYKADLWATSGHLDAYADNMFTVTPGMAAAVVKPGGDGGCGHDHQHSHGGHAAPPAAAAAEAPAAGGDVFGLKPMNCPGHCLIFAHRLVSYRDLPVRLADFSSLHRNEASGALGGLTRARRFQQDDAHIFCGEEHIAAEVHGCLAFVAYVYRLFGFSFRAKLSTRPDVHVGDAATWDRAEDALRAALASSLAQLQGGTAPVDIEVDAGGGAFYGPKIDVFVKDALGREHQCATVQLDFQLPRRFGLAYDGPDGRPATPVIIHRAILGSLERMMGILIEHTGGKWPFWLSPRQVQVVPVAERHVAYAQALADELRFPPLPTPAAAGGSVSATAAAGGGADDEAHGALGLLAEAARASGGADRRRGDSGLWVDVDASDRSVPKKVREAQLAAYNLVLVVGDKEAAARTATVRFRDAPAQAAFMTALAAVDPAAAATAVASAASAAPAPTVTPAKGEAAAAPPPPAPLLELPVATLRATCEEMLRRYL